MPNQDLGCNRKGNGRSCDAGIEAAAHRALTFRAARILRCIGVRNRSGLAIRRHQGRDSRKGDHRSLQADSEYHDKGDELTLHNNDINTPSMIAHPKPCASP